LCPKDFSGFHSSALSFFSGWFWNSRIILIGSTFYLQKIIFIKNMKLVPKILLILIPTVIIFTVFVLGYAGEPEKEPYYKIGLSGIKKQYILGEEITFSLFLNGYGSECGSYKISLKKEDMEIESRSMDIDCEGDISGNLEFVNIDITTLELTLLESGAYTAIGEFSSNDGGKFQEKKTFTVIES